MWTATGVAWSSPDARKLIAVFASPASAQPASPATTWLTDMPRETNVPEIPRKSAGVGAGGVRETRPQPATTMAKTQDSARKPPREAIQAEASTHHGSSRSPVLGSA